MGLHPLRVRFPDGTVVDGRGYQSTSDHAEAELRSAQGEWAAAVEDVEVATTYGGGFWWAGKATRSTLLTRHPMGVENQYGTWDEAPVALHDGLPAWFEQEDDE